MLRWSHVLIIASSLWVFFNHQAHPEDNSQRKKALVIGAAGQDGSYLTELLLRKNYEVYGIVQEATAQVTYLQALLHREGLSSGLLHLSEGDITDFDFVKDLLKKSNPNEIYNLAAQSSVGESFHKPRETTVINALGVLNILEAIRSLGLEKKTKFYQASTSEIFGKVIGVLNLDTVTYSPQSPYAISKLYAHLMTINYREVYGIFACNGILFNHESPRRGEQFVTRKITRAVAAYAHGEKSILSLGNLDSLRDWGYAEDYVEAMWLMLQRDSPEDFVIATGHAHSVREFVEQAYNAVDVTIEWKGQGLEEIGINKRNGDLLVKIDPGYFRPAEPYTLVGETVQARTRLGWQPKVDFASLVKIMVEADMQTYAKESKTQG
jgi:GDPmannose 4,6-dehydratase